MDHLRERNLNKKNALGNRSDIGWKHGTRKDVGPCLTMPDDVKNQIANVLMRNIEISAKKRKEMFDIGDDNMSNEVEQPKQKGSGKDTMEAFVRRKFDGASSTQTTSNQMTKRDLRKEAYQQIARFFYTSAIPFNCVENPEFTKNFDLAGRYGIRFKPPSYHEIREKYLKN